MFSGILIRSSNKKRPNNLVFGRTFDNQVIDLFDGNILEIKGDFSRVFRDFDLSALPSLVCLGDVFETNPAMTRIRNYFTDFFSPFRNEPVFMNADFGMRLIVVLVGYEDQTIEISLSKASGKGTELNDLGVLLRFKVERTKLAEDDLFKEACRSLAPKNKNKKIIQQNTLGETVGRVYVRQQDLKTLRLKKIKKKLGKRDRTSRKEKKNAEETKNGKKESEAD